MMSTKSIIARIINAANAANKTAPTAGIAAIINPRVSANRIDITKTIKSMQHLFFLCLQPL